MAEISIVPGEDIERIVGVERQQSLHVGRVVIADDTFYILHSKVCLEARDSLLDCPYTHALTNVDPDEWEGYTDKPVVLAIREGALFPAFSVHAYKEATDV